MPKIPNQNFPKDILATMAFETALAMDEAGVVLGRAGEDRVKNMAACHPRIVLHAFALEVYLKCLILLEGKNPARNGHALLAIFNALEDKTQKDIEQRFDAECNRRGVPGAGKLIEYLAIDGQPFIDWRYSYEANGSAVWSLGFMLYVIRDVIVEREPNFKAKADLHRRE